MIDEKQTIYSFAKKSNRLKDILLSIIYEIQQDRMGILLEATKESTPTEFVTLKKLLEAISADFLEYWLSMKIDVLLTPAGALPALPHRFSGELYLANSFFFLFNILDLPAGVIPVRLVQQHDVEKSKFE